MINSRQKGEANILIIVVYTKTAKKRSSVLGYLRDSNAPTHSVDSDLFQGSDSSICALQDLALPLIS